jgi:DNA-binding NarL/FixJ family response regulator
VRHFDVTRDGLATSAAGVAAVDRAVHPPKEEVLASAVAQGWTNHEIADGLHISISTVKTHLANLMRKLNARNRVEIAMWAYETGRVKN